MEKSNNSICQHISNYYLTTVGDPIIFCKIDPTQLEAATGFENMILEYTLSESGDDCHADIKNVNKNQSGNFARTNFRPPNIYMCCNGSEKALTLEEYEDLLNNLC